MVDDSQYTQFQNELHWKYHWVQLSSFYVMFPTFKPADFILKLLRWEILGRRTVNKEYTFV